MDPEALILVKEIAAASAKEAVLSTLVSLGIDVKDPIKAQSDFAALRDVRSLLDDEEFSADLTHLRKWRRAVEEVESKGRLALTGIFISGLVAMIWLGVKTKLGLFGP